MSPTHSGAKRKKEEEENRFILNEHNKGSSVSLLLIKSYGVVRVIRSSVLGPSLQSQRGREY